ncbi:hypothetical protein KPL28_06780 [Clostridium algidicarnis]|uniref:DUF6514 family protein n=1 Tax=Clostridium algidicarnis TaxID=37659 RepID=UPI001C0D48BF|nr:DUF6514 family protein [Clostridium algidicarnis]MBU3209338.1 hypothetical protein [Clostridium algidicarnis]
MVIVENLCRSELSENGVHIYSYRMTKGNITFSIEGEKTEVQSYGIEIERQDVLDGVVMNIERDALESISPQRYKIHNLLKILYDGRVSPYHFIDIIGEYVDSYVEDFETGFCDVATN